MNPHDTGKNILWVLLSACLLVLILALDIFSPRAAATIILSYITFALLYLSGHFKILMAVISVTVTLLISILMLTGDSLGIFSGTYTFMMFALWMIILSFALEYIFVSGGSVLENTAMYRQYLLLNMIQSLTLLFSSLILALGPHLFGNSAVPKGIILDACTLLILFFFLSFGLFVSFMLKSMTSKPFMDDFAKALYDMGRDREYEDRKQGLKDGDAWHGSYNTLRRMRFVTYVFFAASLAALFFISKSKIMDHYALQVSGRNVIVDSVIYLIKHPPGAVSGALKLAFFIIDLLIFRDFIRMLKGSRLEKWLKGLYESAQDQKGE